MRRSITVLALLLITVLSIMAVVPGSVTAGEFPLASTGDIWFQIDHAGFLGEQNVVVEEYYLRITNNQLKFEPKDGVLYGRVFLSLKFKDEEDRELGEASSSFEFAVPDVQVAESADDAQILVFREPLDHRARSVEVQVEDLNARKRGILYMFTGKRKNGEARGHLIHPGFIGQDFGMSDLQFAWEVQEATEESAFEKNGLNVIPNPSRSYGQPQPRLTVYYEVYDLREGREERETYFVRHELVDPRDNVLPTTADTVVSASGEFIKVSSFDLSKLTTGEYILRAIVDHPRTGGRTTTERPFNILWNEQFWDRTEQDVLDEARVLFTEEEYERFRNMSAGDRAQYVEKFWRDNDPTPGTSTNELREEFLRRVQYANRQYHQSQMKGMLTDRGRMYIRFGEPDEIYRELMPTGDRQLDNYVGTLTEENISGSMLASKDVIDTRPYEIWTYTRQGTPLFPERERTTTVTGLRFVFVDEMGTGHYVMRYSSDFIGY